MYHAKKFINNEALIYDDVNDLDMTYNFDSYESMEEFVISHNKKLLKEDVAAYRYEKETSGINYGGAIIKTDRESQAQLNSAYNAMINGFTDSIAWKAGDTWVELDQVEAKEIATHTVAHVQKCFKCEQLLGATIDSLNSIPEVVNFNIPVAWDSTYKSL